MEFGWVDGRTDILLPPTRVNPDGSFSRPTTDGGKLEGNFFGSNHKEVAGTYDLPRAGIVGAFGGIRD